MIGPQLRQELYRQVSRGMGVVLNCKHNEWTLKMADPNPEIARAMMLEVIENQINDDTPPETKQTYDRLIADGHSHEETMNMIACAVAAEIHDVIKQEQSFNLERYVAALHNLPEIPRDNEDD